MAVVLKNIEFFFAESEKDFIREAVNILMDELFGINVELCEKLIASALETYLADRILSLPQHAIEESYCTLYETISRHHECKMLTGVTQIEINNTAPVDAVDSLGLTQQEKEKVFKRAAALMRTYPTAIKRQGVRNLAEVLETDSVDLYENILKPMVKVGQDFVSAAKEVGTDSDDLYKNLLKPMVKIGNDFVPEAKEAETDSDDLYKNLLKPMVKIGNDFVSEDIAGLMFVDCMEDMLKLLDTMRGFETSFMSMESPGNMMVAASA